MANPAVSYGALRAAFAALLVSAASSAFGAETVLYQFQGGTDGQAPHGNLVADSAGNLYGTTGIGGARGDGTVFKLAANGTETILYSFQGGNDAANPTSLVMDSAGNLYGVAGGNYYNGTVFKVTPSGTESILHAFQGGTDGAVPSGQLLIDRHGNLYGTTEYGGDLSCKHSGGEGCGTVFKIEPDGRESILYSFEHDADGATPWAGVIADKAGNLYGTTLQGGSYQGDCAAYNGCGTVFELKPNGREKVLYAFQGGNDGIWPFAGLVADKSGNLYGATSNGCAYTFGCVFKLAPDGTETVLHAFLGGHDGLSPQQNLTRDAKGYLYGLTAYGGNEKCHNDWGCGAAFEIAPDGTESVLDIFRGGENGKYPYTSLLMGSNGIMYGTTTKGGACLECGVVFSLRK